MKQLLRYILIFFIGYYTASQQINLLIPIFIIIIWRIRYKIIFFLRDFRGILFEGDDVLFKKHIIDVDTYGEYGVGNSTVWVSKHTNSKIISVETDLNWLKKVKLKIGKIQNSNRFELGWVDLGEVSDWGTPESYDKRNNTIKYVEYIWTKSSKPDLILIDGRFRVACFLMCLVEAREGAKIIFDDYVGRKYYHIVEDFLKPYEFSSRQALFIVPRELNKKKIQEYLTKFLFVMD